MASLFMAAGHEVHIITGSVHDEKLEQQLETQGLIHGKHYTCIFSISSYLIDNGENVRWEDSNNPWFDKEIWNKVKGEYCEEKGIDMHFDDTEEYADYFSTPFYFKKKVVNKVEG